LGQTRDFHALKSHKKHVEYCLGLARSDGLDTAVRAALFGQVGVHVAVLAAHFSDGVEWLSVGVGATARVRWYATAVYANVLVVKVGQVVLSVQPDRVVKA
jgi:1,4-dihydroxy-2-naphthoyl-CoA synthase